MPDISEKHIQNKKRIGTLDGKPIIELCTTGGLYLVVMNKAGSVEILGSGPHRAVARYIAKKRAPSLLITELSKSDSLDITSILSVTPKYEAFTDAMNSAARGQ